MKTTVVSSPAFELTAELTPNRAGINLTLSTRIPIANHPAAIPKLQVNLTRAELQRFATWIHEASGAFATPPGHAVEAIADKSDTSADVSALDWFEVNEYGTLTPLGYQDPETRGALLAVQLPTRDDNESLMEVLERNVPISEWAASFAMREADDLLDELRSFERRLTAEERKRAQVAHVVLDTNGEAWPARVQKLSDEERAHWRAALQEWLDGELDSHQWEYLPDNTTGQRLAFRYFSDLSADNLDAIGVVTVEGDRPGSSYIAAELEDRPEDANRVAEWLGLSCRFCRPGDRINARGEIEE